MSLMQRRKEKWFSGCAWRRGLWFRIFGYGLHVQLRAGHVPLFSERYGYRKALYLGPLRFEFLRPGTCVWD